MTWSEPEPGNPRHPGDGRGGAVSGGAEIPAFAGIPWHPGRPPGRTGYPGRDSPAKPRERRKIPALVILCHAENQTLVGLSAANATPALCKNPCATRWHP